MGSTGLCRRCARRYCSSTMYGVESGLRFTYQKHRVGLGSGSGSRISGKSLRPARSRNWDVQERGARMKNPKQMLAMTSVLGLAVLAISLCVGMVLAADTPEPPAVGATAPDFTLNSQAGTPVSLHEFRGKWVVLYFYPKDFTSGCTIEAHGFPRRSGAIPDQEGGKSSV